MKRGYNNQKWHWVKLNGINYCWFLKAQKYVYELLWTSRSKQDKDELIFKCSIIENPKKFEKIAFIVVLIYGRAPLLKGNYQNVCYSIKSEGLA